MTAQELKYQLHEQCTQLLAIRLDSIQKTIKDLNISLREETKNTSGDKHHTGRAMLQIEREKAGNQLREIENVLRLLDRVAIEDNSAIAKLGSIIKTNQANFFLCISVGKLEADETIYLGVAPNSPIGRNLLGKEKGEQFNFNGTVYKILEVV